MKKMNLKLCNNSDNLLADAQSIIDFARQEAFRSINITMVQRNCCLVNVLARKSCWGKIVQNMGMKS